MEFITLILLVEKSEVTLPWVPQRIQVPPGRGLVVVSQRVPALLDCEGLA